MVFGRTLLRAVFKYIRKQIMDQFYRERDTMPPDRRQLLLTNFPPFLNQLDEEIYASNSPIWDPDFKATSVHFQSLLDSRLRGLYIALCFLNKIGLLVVRHCINLNF